MKSLLIAALIFTTAPVFAANTYKLDAKASSVEWKGSKRTGSSHHGHVQVKDGQIEMDDKGDMKAGMVVVDMASITNVDLKDAEYNKKLVGHLSSGDFFDVAKFPTATFKITEVKPGKEAGKVQMKGELTFIGKTQAIEFPATMKTEKNQIVGEAQVKVDRTKWGLKYGSGNFFKELTADKIISDEFELTLKLVAKK